MLRTRLQLPVLLILCLLLGSGFAGIRAQQLLGAEYFWDTDPGYGNGYSFTAQDGNFNEALENIIRNSAPLPSTGLHLLNIRVKDDNDNWGPLYKKAVQVTDTAQLLTNTKITAAEFFWDTDPGNGSGTAMLAFDGNFNEALEQAFANTSSLPTTGLHLFNIRVRDGKNKWGPVFKKVVQLNDAATTTRLLTVKAAEYFWDTDPGYGSASALLAFDGGFNEALEQVFTNTATLPATGLHLFNIRVKAENNNWGPLFKKAVQVTDAVNNPRLLTVKAAEYFWDTDPGYGSANALLAFDGNFNEALEQVFTNNATLPATGLHLFNIRVKAENNNWGPLFKKAVSVSNVVNSPRLLTVKAAECFWDTIDPGYGNGIALLAFDGNFNEALEAVNGTLNSLIEGLHRFNIRVKDESNNWGPLFKKAVFITDQPRGLILTQAEYFWDADPGYGNGYPLLAFDGNFNEALEQVRDSNATLAMDGIHLLNVRIKDEKGRWGPLFKKAVNIQAEYTGLNVLLDKGNSTLCANDSLIIQASGAGSYRWFPSTGLNKNIGAVVIAKPTTTTTYMVVGQGDPGVYDTAYITITVISGSIALNLGNDTSVCSPATITLNAGSATSYTWSTGATSQTISVNSTGNYAVTITNAAGCHKSDTIHVTVDTLTASILPATASVCSGSSVTLSASGGNTYNWSNSLGTNPNVLVSPTSNTTYTVTVTKGACVTTVNRLVTVKQPTAGTITASICAGQSYLFNGVNRTTAGSYLDTLVNAAGCDSILTLNLTVKPTTSGSFAVSICAGQSYLFNGINRSSSGAYLDTLTGSNGCDSIVTLNLTVKPTTSGSFSATICQGQSYLFNGINRTTSGAYLDTLTGSNGCDSIVTLNLTVKPTTSGSFSATICQGQSYLFNGVNRTTSGAYLDTLTGSNGCDSIITLNLTVKPTTSGSFSATICQGQSYLFNGVNRTTSGAYLDTLTGSNGCDSIVTLNLTVKPTTSGSFSATICQGQSYLFNGVNRTTSGAYLDTLTGSNGCDSIVTLNLTVKPTTSGSFSATICQGQSYLFNGVNRTTSGAYLDTLTGSNGCDSIVTLNLTVKPNSTGTINASICQGQSYLFNGVNRTTSGTYLDTLVSANGCDSILTLNLTVKAKTTGTINAGICQGQSYFFNGVNRTTTGTYLDTLVNAAGCDSILTLNLTVNATVTSSFNQSICAGSSYFFNGQNLTTSGAYKDTLVAVGGCDSVVTLNLTVKSTTSGTLNVAICPGQSYFFNGVNRSTAGSYLDTLTGSNGCDSILTLNLSIKSTTSGSFSATICQGQSYLFNGINRTTSGAYLDTLVGSNGCDSVVTLNLTVKPTTSGSFAVSICQGQSYLFNGINRSASGAYLDTLTGSNGCDSVVTLNLTVKPTTSGTINASICQGQSYLFNGVNRTTSGTYLDTLINTAGCDSILTLNLTVKAKTTGTINASICQGQSYLFNGVSRTTTGTYLDTLVNSVGCDSVLTLNLTVNSIVTSSFNQSICAGSTYFFNGQNLNTSGTYKDTLVAVGGCDSVVTLNLTVKPTTTGTINASICAGSSYLFNGVNRTTSGTYLDTLTGSNGCDSLLTLNLTVKPTTSGSFSASICQGQSYLFNGINRTSSGAYLDTVTGSNGCDSVVTLNLTVKPSTTGSIAASICQGQSYLFNGVNRTTSGTYLDTLVNSAGCDSILTLNLTVKAKTTGTINASICQGQSYLFNGINRTATGTYLDTLVNSAGCDSILTLNLTVNTTVTGSFSQSICIGSSYLFNGQQLTQSGSYNDTLTATGGCDSIVTLHLTVNPVLTGSFSQAICAGGSYLFNGQQLSQAGTYYDTLQTTGGCDSVVTLTLTVNNPSSGSAAATICQGQGYLFNGVTHYTAGTYLDTLVNSKGCDSILTLTLTVTPALQSAYADTICNGESYAFNGQALTQGGSYRDTLQSVAGCDSIVTLTLVVRPLPVATINRTNDTLSTQTFSSYQWLLNNATLNGATQQKLVMTQDGNYSVIVTDAHGCSDTSVILNATGVTVNELTADWGLTLFPNPNTGTFTLAFSNDAQRTVRVTDAAGKLVWDNEVSEKQNTITLPPVAAGIYFVHVQQQARKATLKIVLLK